MAAFQVAVCALALFAFLQLSSACGIGYGCGYDPLVVDVETYCVPSCGYGGYSYGGCGCGGCGYGGCGCGYGGDCCCCCCEPITEITTVSCLPVVETFLEPCYGGNYCGYGYPGYGYGRSYRY